MFFFLLLGLVFTISPVLRIIVGQMCIVGQLKRHFSFPLAPLCTENIWEKVLLIKEVRSLARKAVTDLVALARPLSALGFMEEMYYTKFLSFLPVSYPKK